MGQAAVVEQDRKNVAVLIPAYKPETAVIDLSRELKAEGFDRIIVVDDGSGDEFAAVFDTLKEIGCRVVAHAENRGKGRAVKTGMETLLDDDDGFAGLVTADADGQHLAKDIGAVADELLETEDTLVLGSRFFSADVPWKSRAGNAITRKVFHFASGEKVYDTQTGLRGIPFSAVPALKELPGDRYEYEMTMLARASSLRLHIKEIPIETVYVDDNSGSHFRPFRDSLSIYRTIFMFAGSSLLAGAIDFLVFALITFIVPNVLAAAVVGARVVSSLVNFLVNRNVIFGRRGQSDRFARHLIGYYLLAVSIVILNYLMIRSLSALGLNVFVAKLITESVLFFFSFTAQKLVVFRR